MNKNFKVTKEMIQAAEDVFIAIAYSETIRPAIIEIQQNILKRFQYKVDEQASKARLREPIVTHERSYLMSDNDFSHYLTHLHKEYIMAGFKVEYGYCPLLIAEDIQRNAEKKLITVMESVSGISFDMIFMGPAPIVNKQKLIDIYLKLLASYCKNPFK
ncbi:hypothetical protein [Chitinophaga sp. CF418]|uniref:hypothetical protein n=1 Tax=Chitinophaga sp. CF418 TaxID=1855287 RepID=UPI00092252DE|nr:hypothetical protein [Chitinophaga sp. CF418]SHN42196.1 hypothetical protein SAMN05216311_114125 [Chitinophaga sp. CF418]